jgi:hypothetical protein
MGQEVAVSKQKRAIYFLSLAVTLMGCGSQKRQEGLTELQRIQSAMHDIDIVVAAGTNEVEFSRRLTDSLVKIGDLQQSEKKALNGFAKSEQPAVAQVYRHLLQASEAYKQSKDFFGDTHQQDLDPFDRGNTFVQERYDELQHAFPNLEPIPVAIDYGHKEYWKGDMLQALWKVAFEEDVKAKELVDQLSHK